jgi:hypothetical protein
MNHHAAEEDAGFFPDFTSHSFLDAFGWLAETGEGGIPVWRPTLLSAEEDSFGVVADDGHDY